MWLAYALLAPFFWSAVHVLDEHCVDNLFEKPWIGVITSSLASCVIYLTIPFLVPWIDWNNASLHLLLLAFFAGILIQCSQFFYFSSLAQSEAGIVSAYWNMIPAFLAVIGYVFFSQNLELTQYLGIVVLITCSTLMCSTDIHKNARKKTLLLMVISSILQILAYLIMEHVYHHIDFIIGFYAVVTGLIVSGIIPIFVKKIRHLLLKNVEKIKPSVRLFVFIEILNLLALCAAQLAISLSHASLVAAAETTVPMFTFVLSVVWLIITRQSTQDVTHKFYQKIFISIGMVIGVMML